VASETHTTEPIGPATAGAATPIIGKEASSAPVTGSRRWTAPRPPLSASPTTSTVPAAFADRSELVAPGSAIEAVIVPRGSDRCSRRSPPTTQSPPPATTSTWVAQCGAPPVSTCHRPVSWSVSGLSLSSTVAVGVEPVAVATHSAPAATMACSNAAPRYRAASTRPVAASTRASSDCTTPPGRDTCHATYSPAAVAATCGISNGRPYTPATPDGEDTAAGWLANAGAAGADGDAGMLPGEPRQAPTRTPAAAEAASTATDRTGLPRPAGDPGTSRAARKRRITLTTTAHKCPELR